jgi:hypothetical protein
VPLTHVVMGGAGQPVLDDMVGPVVAHDVLSLWVMVVVVVVAPLAWSRWLPGCLKQKGWWSWKVLRRGCEAATPPFSRASLRRCHSQLWVAALRMQGWWCHRWGTCPRICHSVPLFFVGITNDDPRGQLYEHPDSELFPPLFPDHAHHFHRAAPICPHRHGLPLPRVPTGVQRADRPSDRVPTASSSSRKSARTRSEWPTRPTFSGIPTRDSKPVA